MDLRKVGELSKGVLVTQRHVEETVVGQSRHGSKSSALLATSLSSGTDEQAGVLAPVGTSLPLTTGGVPEGLPLSREVSVTGWDTEEESIVLLKSLGVGQGWNVGVLGWDR